MAQLDAQIISKILAQMNLRVGESALILPANWQNTEGVKIFVSHHHEEKGVARDLAGRLQKYGLQCFVAHTDTKVSKEWEMEIEKALISADVFVMVNSEHFDSSFWCQQEAGFALATKAKIIPLDFGCIPKAFVNRYQAMHTKDRNLDEVASEILKELWVDPRTEHFSSNQTPSMPNMPPFPENIS